MGVYEKCKDSTNRSISQQCKTTALLQVSKNDISTYLSILSIDFNDDWTCSQQNEITWFGKYRNHGLLNISPNDFFETELIIPKSFEK